MNLPLHPPLLGRAAAVVRDRRDVGDVGDLQAAGVQRADRGLAAGAGALDAHFHHLHAVFLRDRAGLLGGDLRGERRALARAAETAAARSRPRERVALAIGDRDDRVVERRVHVRDRVRDVLLDLLAAGLPGAATGGLALLLLLLISHSSSAKPLRLTGGRVHLDRRLARALARARVRARALTTQRQAAAMTDAAIAAEIHQAFDVHRDFAAQIAFDRQLADLRAQGSDFGLGEVLHDRVRFHVGACASLESLRAADAEDRREADPHVLVHRNVDAGDTSHCLELSCARRKARKFKLKTLETQCIKRRAEARPTACYPCLCLWRASEVQITYTTRRRRTILQFLQIFLTEARTFMTNQPLKSDPGDRNRAGWPSSSGPRTGATSGAPQPVPGSP